MSNIRINRAKACEAFKQYAEKYNLDDVKIALKYKHMYRVAELCERLAESLHLGKIETDICWLTGLLHDIGRFEQVRQYGTFVDAKSVDHAELSAKILFGDDILIGMFAEEGCESIVNDKATLDLEAIRDAILCHSMYRIPELEVADVRLAKILRDADKLDIFRVMTETPLEDIYNVSSEELYTSPITDEVLDCFYEEHAIPRAIKKTPIDNLVGHVCLYHELEFDESRRIAEEEGYFGRMISFRGRNADTNRKFEEMRRQLMGTREIYLAGGCFWGTEKAFTLLDGVTDTEVGYANGCVENPSYEMVCTGKTGACEAVKVTYNPDIVSLDTILEALFIIIDPTRADGQGGDIGTQYRTGVYYTDPADESIVKDFFEKEKVKYSEFHVEMGMLGNFYDAEEYHQDYLEKNPAGYCHVGIAEFGKVAALNNK